MPPARGVPLTPMVNEADALRRLHFLGWMPAAILDVGAYRGDWTWLANCVWPDVKILMVEPLVHMAEPLRALIRRMGPQIFYSGALLLEEPGLDVDFHIANYKGHCTGSSVYPEYGTVERVTVRGRSSTLDQLTGMWEGPPFDFLKLDTQGSEKRILEGASKTLETIEVIQVEMSLIELNEGAPLFGDVVAFLNERNFVLFDICDSKRIGDNVLGQVDGLFVKADGVVRSLARRALDMG